MPYTIHQIIPLNTWGIVRIGNDSLQYSFTYSAPSSFIGNLYLNGATTSGIIKEQLFIIRLTERSFRPVYERMCSHYKIEMKNIEPHIIQYQLLITGTNLADKIESLNFDRFVNVFFSNSFKKIILQDGKEIDIIENEIEEFIRNMGMYDLG